MKSSKWIAGALASVSVFGLASAQDVHDQFGLLLPQPGTAGIDNKIGLSGRLEENTGLGQVDVFVPFSTSDSSTLFGELGGRYRFEVSDDDDDDVPEIDFQEEDGWSAFAGIGWRSYVGESTVLGLNAYLEGGEATQLGDGDDEFFGMATIGAEYQQVFNFESATTLTMGLNGYIPFEDYTEAGDPDADPFIANGRTPRLGADIYATLGHNFTGADLRLEGTVGGFYYEGQDDNDEFADDFTDFEEGDDLPGVIGELALTYYGVDGFNLKGTGGIRWADYNVGDDDDVEWYAGLRAEFTWGGDRDVERTVTREETVQGSAVVPERDCAVIQNADGSTSYDCSQRVVTDAGAIRDAKGTKGGTYVAEPLPAAPATTRTVTETVTETVPGLPVPSPRRHIAFGGPLVPANFDGDPVVVTTPPPAAPEDTEE